MSEKIDFDDMSKATQLIQCPCCKKLLRVIYDLDPYGNIFSIVDVNEENKPNLTKKQNHDLEASEEKKARNYEAYQNGYTGEEKEVK